MWIVIPIVVGSVVLVVAGFTWAARREALERARRVQSLTVQPLDAVREPTLVAVRADATRPEPIVDPVTGQRVAYYEARLSRVDGGEKVLRAVREGDVITLEDAGARVEARVDGAELGIAWDEPEESEAELTPAMRALLSAADLPIPERDANARYSLAHRAIAIGEPVTLVGTPRFDERTSTRAGYRGGAGALPRFDASSDLLILTRSELGELQQREKSDVRAMSRMLRVATGIGVVLVTIGAVLMAMAA